MRRFLSTRQGFFVFAALVCWSTLAVIDREFRWVAAGVGCLYVVLALLFGLEESSRARLHARERRRR